jgi:hypothetical protein
VVLKNAIVLINPTHTTHQREKGLSGAILSEQKTALWKGDSR